MVLGKEKKTQLASNRRCSDSSNSTNSKKLPWCCSALAGPAANLGPKDFRIKKKKKEKKKKEKAHLLPKSKEKKKNKMSGDKSGDKSVTAFRKFALSAEKKMAGKLASKSTVRAATLDDDTAALLDHLSDFITEASGKEIAHEVKKDMIKVVVKIGLLLKNDLLTNEEIEVLRSLRRKLVTTVNMMITFEETPFTYDGEFLQQSFHECRDLCVVIVTKHLTEKSVGRTNHVFNYFADPETTRLLFCDPRFKQIQKDVVTSLKTVVDKNII